MINPHAVEVSSLVLLAPLFLAGWKGRRALAGRWLARFAARRTLAAVSVGLAALAIRAALLPLHPLPVPSVMDEYSYLLAADTFASGRAANPAHPFWEHFETFSVLSQPTYASKYPPAQGLVLAAGMLLAHNAWVGVWLSVGAMCAAIVWMLQGWLPPRWALLGGILVLLRIAIGSYWMDSYWGGALAATGGALLYGALPRMMRWGRVRDSLILGAGLAILANSRPFEGLLAAAPAGVALAVWAWPRGLQAFRQLAPAAAVLGMAAVAMVAYNHAVTGSPWRMPYQVHETQYAVAPLFWFQPLRPEPVYRHAVMKALWTGGARDVYVNNFRVGLWSASMTKLENVWLFFLGPWLTVPLIALPWALRDKRLRLIYIALGVFLVGLLAEIDVVPHYAAPVTALIYLAVVQCLRHMAARRAYGRLLAGALPVVLAGTLALFYGLEAGGIGFLHEHYSWCFTKSGNLERARMERQLDGLAGQHLVLMHYGPHHDPYAEWVYNRADIEGAKVVWAREMDAERDRALVGHFAGRRVWVLDPDESPARLKPYAAAEGQLSLVSGKP